MGHRTLKRVPLDFNYPRGKVWKGYINPHRGPRKCKVCDGSGYNPETHQIAEDFYDHDGLFSGRWRYQYYVNPQGEPTDHPPWMIIGDCHAWHDKITQDEVMALANNGRLMDFTHTWTPGEGWKPKKWETKGFWCPKCYHAMPQLSADHHSGFCTECNTEMKLLEGNDIRLHVPTAEEVNAREHCGMGHDAINSWILTEVRAKRLGVFGKCPKCKGKGETKLPRKMKKRYKNWHAYEPPTGPGYQLWETCTEGSPVSPVFESAEELADWCADNATIFAREKTSRENQLF